MHHRQEQVSGQQHRPWLTAARQATVVSTVLTQQTWGLATSTLCVQQCSQHNNTTQHHAVRPLLLRRVVVPGTAPNNDDCTLLDQPAAHGSSVAQTGKNGSAARSSRGHAGATSSSSDTQPSTSAAVTAAACGSASSASSSPSNSNSSSSSSSIVLSDLQELTVIGSGSSGVVKKVLHRPTQQVRLAWGASGRGTAARGRRPVPAQRACTFTDSTAETGRPLPARDLRCRMTSLPLRAMHAWAQQCRTLARTCYPQEPPP